MQQRVGCKILDPTCLAGQARRRLDVLLQRERSYSRSCWQWKSHTHRVATAVRLHNQSTRRDSWQLGFCDPPCGSWGLAVFGEGVREGRAGTGGQAAETLLRFADLLRRDNLGGEQSLRRDHGLDVVDPLVVRDEDEVGCHVRFRRARAGGWSGQALVRLGRAGWRKRQGTTVGRLGSRGQWRDVARLSGAADGDARVVR